MQHTHTENRVLRIKSVVEATGLSVASIYRLAESGAFPKQIKLGPRAVGWRSNEVYAWIDSRAAARCQ
ncbi:helix-turn-helix transcriptional regulator [Burkholderia vietnamiensis]|uniref:helix-turn-helix transcriptional regulator n=1 Tax=Burkholderia vietnamiensis TaxID=60552 RepID=UPI00158B4909|nr:AlpA family transcriptional regulator [Burkholderia vietnamiensis]